MSELDRFHHHSGLAINYDKTVLLRMSSQENLPHLYTRKNVAWTTEGVTVLGHTYSIGKCKRTKLPPTTYQSERTAYLMENEELNDSGQNKRHQYPYIITVYP